MSGTTPSLTSSSAIRCGVSARLRRIGASHFLRKDAVAVVAAVIDGALRLRARTREVEDESFTVGIVSVGASQRDPLRVQLRRVDTIVLGVVLPYPAAHWDPVEDLAAVRLGGAVENRVEARLDAVAAVPAEQLLEPARTHQARGALCVEVRGERLQACASCG